MLFEIFIYYLQIILVEIRLINLMLMLMDILFRMQYLLLMESVLFFLYWMKNADLAATIHLSCVAILSVVAVVLANTWAKKRGN